MVAHDNLMHHGVYLENILWWNFVIKCCLHFNLPLCCEIGAQMNNSITNWNTFLVCNNVGETLKLF
jgi:hypothetical protein